MEIRRYQSGEEDSLVALHERAMRQFGVEPSDVPDIDDLREVQTAYIDSGGEFLVAVDQGEIVGMGGLKVEQREAGPPRGELFRMRVDPDSQREGIGAALLEQLETAARERGVERLHAETSDRQTAAKAFYPKHGFEAVGQRTVGEYVIHHYEKLLDGVESGNLEGSQPDGLDE